MHRLILFWFWCFCMTAVGQSLWKSEEMTRHDGIPEARQGVAVDEEFFYAINNREIGKYRKEDGSLAARWEAGGNRAFVHLNAGLVRGGKLYLAHSNYPALPMKSSVEIWGVENLEHVGRHDFGATDGSLTWIDEQGGNWYAAFVHYAGKGGVPGRGPEASKVIKFDASWNPVQSWTFPPELVRRFAGHSSSCGAFGPGGYLYVTGHDARELYVLEIPETGTVLHWVATIPVAFEGQGFAWDPAAKDVVYGILRKKRQVVAVRVLPE
jgi:outer membrane protein assembly factor BamB